MPWRSRPVPWCSPAAGWRTAITTSQREAARTRIDWIARRWRSEVAAIRETFEECGVLLARPVGSDRLIDAGTLKRLEDQHRGALNAGSIAFDAVLGSEGLLPAPDLLVHFAHWITPSNQPKRYDTHFFLAEAPA